MYKILFKSSVIMLALTGLFISVIAQKTDLTKKYGKYYLAKLSYGTFQKQIPLITFYK